MNKLQQARDLKLQLLKGHNINDPQQVKELAIVKDQIAQLENDELSTYTITATLTKTYEIKVLAKDPQNAIDQLDEWISDDFEEFETSATWEFKAI
jgi:hypothetical protein